MFMNMPSNRYLHLSNWLPPMLETIGWGFANTENSDHLVSYSMIYSR